MLVIIVGPPRVDEPNVAAERAMSWLAGKSADL